jgi:O-antigen/teichoic acid export membrane protein
MGHTGPMSAGLAVSPRSIRVPVVAAKPLRVGFSWSFVGWVGYAGCQWLMLSVMAKLGNPTAVGQFAFALALSAPVFMFTNLNLRVVQSTDALNDYSFSDYAALRCLGSLAALTAIGVTSFFLKLPRSASVVVLLVGLFKFFESFGDLVAGLMQKFEKLDRASIALLLRGSISIGVFAVVFAIWRSLPLSLVAWTACSAAVIGSYDFRVAQRLASFSDGEPFLKWSRLRSLAAVSLPLGVVSTIMSFNTNIPRYTIQHVLSVADLGIFASIAYPVTAATIISNSLGQSALARLSRLFAEKRVKEFKQLVLKLVAVGAGLGLLALIVVLACGNSLLAILYTPEYTTQGSLFALLALVAGLNCVGCFLTYALTAARQFRVQLPISATCMLTTFLASTFLVPRFHLPGAALALLCSACVSIAATGAMLKRSVARASGGPERDT